MEEAHFIFTSEPIEVKAEGKDFFIEGYISTSDLDLVNDIVTKACLMDMAEQMKERVIKFDVEHEAFRGKSKIEREINKTKIPVAKVDDFLMDKKGLKVRAKLNPHSTRFDEVKGSIEEGFLDAFSIAYIPTKTMLAQKNGQSVRMLDKLNLLNVAFTGNPVNTEAKMVKVFAKSLEFLKDQEDHTHESDQIKLQEAKNKMSEENEKVDETQESENSEEGKPESEKKDNEDNDSNEQETEDSEEEDTEVKSLKAEVKSLNEKIEAQNKEIAEVKALVKKPVRKSTVEQKDKSDNFVGEKSSQNPLDLIA